MHERSEIAAAAAPPGLTRVYLIAAVVLIAITALEVSTVLVFPVPPPARAGILIVLALMKASLIGAYYMNLKFERLAMAYIAVIPLMLLILMLFSILPDAAQLIRHR
jgi:cytochrome c oxidase subunit IV